VPVCLRREPALSQNLQRWRVEVRHRRERDARCARDLSSAYLRPPSITHECGQFRTCINAYHYRMRFGRQTPVEDTNVIIETRPETQDHEPGDHERFAHYVRKEKIVESAVTGTPVTALCGKKWVPSRVKVLTMDLTPVIRSSSR
jgi:Protein of unknown function (DUF3039)